MNDNKSMQDEIKNYAMIMKDIQDKLKKAKDIQITTNYLSLK